MSKRSTVIKLVAMGLIVAMQGLYTLPPAASDAPAAAAISGTVLSTSGQGPVAGATIHVGDPASGTIVSSSPTGDDGRFAVEGLEPSSYEVAVESEGGLFIASSAVRLAPGQTQALDISIDRQAAPDPATAKQGYQKTGLWNNPLTASLIVLGSALVIGILIDETIDDDPEPNASPSAP